MVQRENHEEKAPPRKDGEEAVAMRRPRVHRPFSRAVFVVVLGVLAMGVIGIVIPLVSGSSTSSIAADVKTIGPVKVGAPAPDFAFTTVDGVPRHLSQFRGRPVMLWFFATWCPTCYAGATAVVKNFDRLQETGLQIIQLKLYQNLGYPGPSVEAFAKRTAGGATRTPSWLWGDASREVSYSYDPRGTPDIYFLIDKDGVVREIRTAPNVTMDAILAFGRRRS